MAKARIIALYSPAPQAGKSTVASALEQDLGFARAAFAEPIKAIIAAILREAGYSEKEIYDRLYGGWKELPIDEFSGMSARQVFRTIGTECFRDMINPMLWVRLMELKIHRARAAHMDLVIDDLRFPEEYEMLVANRATLVKIVSPFMQEPSSHRSDGALDGHGFHFDSIIENDGTLDQLRSAALYI
jgi:hypothetical protein